MKNIKYFAAFLAAVLVFGACDKGDGLSQQNKDKEKPYVTLSQKVADDVTLTFEITASEDAQHYAYAVFAGSDNAAPAAYDLLVGETLGADAGAFTVGEDKVYTQTVTVDCSAFPSETYQIFAAAMTETGLLSDVLTLDVTMNDTWIPQPAGAQTDGNSITLAFDELIKRGTGKATVSVIAWGVSQYFIKDQVIAEENIAVEANTVTIVCPEAGNGAGYILSFEAGLVTDLSGNPCAACKSGLENGVYVNLGWDTEWVNFNITEDSFVTPAEDTDWSAEDASLTFKLPVQVKDKGLKNPIKVVYAEEDGNYQLYAEYVIAEDAQTVTVYLPKMPVGQFDVTVEEGAFYDIWGNINNAFAPTEYRYANYLADPVVGGNLLIDYIYPDEEGNVVNSQFKAYLDVVDRNTVILQADWFEAFGSLSALPMLVGTVNYDTHEITFDGTHYVSGKIYSGAYTSLFYYYDEAGTMGLVFMGGGEDGTGDVIMKFTEDGHVTSISVCGYTVNALDAEGNVGEMLGIFGVTEEESAVTYASTTAQTVAKAPRLSHYREVEFKG